MENQKKWMPADHSMHAPVCIAACSSYDRDVVERALHACVETMGGLDWVYPGMTIAIKVNLVSGLSPDKAATTHPAIVDEMARLLTQRGARVMIGDSPGGLFTAGYVSRVYAAAGMDQLLRDGVSLNEDFSVRDAVFAEAVSAKTFTYTGWLDGVDAIINICKLKTHAMMAMTCGVKNLFGTIPGTTKPEYHMRFPDTMAFANLMVDLNEYFHPVFTIVDAVVGMEGNGPTAGSPRQIGALIAGQNPYNVDLVCADILGLTRKDVPTIEAAYRRGLCPADAAAVAAKAEISAAQLRPDDFSLVTRSMTTTFGGDGVLGRMAGRFCRWALDTRPQVKAAQCIGCGKCAKICPAGAIRMTDGRPSIDRGKCIHCFCCQEFCPKGAMKVKRNPIGAAAAKLNRAHTDKCEVKERSKK